jgi:hypothetical protein
VHRLVTEPAVPRSELVRLRDELSAFGREPGTEHFARKMADLGALAEDEWPLRGLERIAPWLRSWSRARDLETLRWLAEASRDPATFLSPDAEGAEPPGGGEIADVMMPNLLDSVYKLLATEESRKLAELAVRLRLEAVERGAYPEVPSGRAARAVFGDPTATHPTLERRADGSVVLTHPAAAAAWEERWGEMRAPVQPPPYTWELPAPRGP